MADLEWFNVEVNEDNGWIAVSNVHGRATMRPLDAEILIMKLQDGIRRIRHAEEIRHAEKLKR